MATSTEAEPDRQRNLRPSINVDGRQTAVRRDVIASCIDQARRAGALWSESSIPERLRCIREIRHRIAECSGELAASVRIPQRVSSAETIASEILPLAEACRFLENEAVKLLSPRRMGRRGRPLWQPGVDITLHREPFGVVLIVGASNYPLLLTGVQTLQALVAGNAVLIKPGSGSSAAAMALLDRFTEAGVSQHLVQVLEESPSCVESAIDVGVDKVVLTGSASTGRIVQGLLAESLVPATMELSGVDAAFVLDDAELGRVADCLAFGLTLNGSATCIAPRRVFVHRTRAAELESRLIEGLAERVRTRREPKPPNRESQPSVDRAAQLVDEAVRQGARIVVDGIERVGSTATVKSPTVVADATPSMQLLNEDLFAPVMSLVGFSDEAVALAGNDECPYALGATVFGERRHAQAVAGRLNAGCIVINDMIAPTADPRVPFGGRKQSGFGVTRGAAGLEEMTRLKAVITQGGRWLPHLDLPTPQDSAVLQALLQMTHGRTLLSRARSAWHLMKAAREQRAARRSPTPDARLQSPAERPHDE